MAPLSQFNWDRKTFNQLHTSRTPAKQHLKTQKEQGNIKPTHSN
jgi:hypothetical protein